MNTAMFTKAKAMADERFFNRYGYYCQWPRGSVEDRRVWVKDYHHAKKLLMRRSGI